MSERRSWAEKRAEIMSAAGAGAGYEAARIRFEFGEAVWLRTTGLVHLQMLGEIVDDYVARNGPISCEVTQEIDAEWRAALGDA